MFIFGTRKICGNYVMNRLTFLCTHPQPLTRRFYSSSVVSEKSMSSAKIFWIYLKIHTVYPSSVLRTHWSVNLNIKWHFIYTSCSIRKSQDKFFRSSWPFDIRLTSASIGFQEPRWELILVSCLVRVVYIAAFVTSCVYSGFCDELCIQRLLWRVDHQFRGVLTGVKGQN
jgi:hypothetical protein